MGHIKTLNRFSPIVKVHKGACSGHLARLRAIFIDGLHVDIQI